MIWGSRWNTESSKHSRVRLAIRQADSNRWKSSKRQKAQKSVGKVLGSVFWDAHAIIFIDFLEKRQKINGDYSIAIHWNDEMVKKNDNLYRRLVEWLDISLETLFHSCFEKFLWKEEKWLELGKSYFENNSLKA